MNKGGKIINSLRNADDIKQTQLKMFRSIINLKPVTGQQRQNSVHKFFFYNQTPKALQP